MPSLILAPPPLQTPIVETDRRPGSVLGAMTRVFADWLTQNVLNRINQASYALTSISLTGQNTSIGVTALVPVAAAGRYRISIHTRVTTAAGVGSALGTTISYTNGGVACTQDATGMASNTISLPISSTLELVVDASTAISYSTTYNSNPAGQMVYAIDILCEII